MILNPQGQSKNFNVHMPLFTDQSEQRPDRNIPRILYGNERILLVDDEPDIIEVEQQILKKLGYQVTSHTSSVQALETFRQHPNAYDMVITDMAMPVMQGEKLCAEIIKIRPDIPILVCTGFHPTLCENKALSIGIKGFILKPVILKELSNKIREILP